MAQSGTGDRIILRLLFSSSLASLAYELALMRVFSVSLWYHFAFMVISISLLGIAASGTALSVFAPLRDLRRVPIFALMQAAAIPASYLLANAVPFDPARLSWDRTQPLLVGLYYVLLCVPFFCFGLIAANAYSALSRRAAAVYASDLTGAGAGALAMVCLLSLHGPETSIFIISALLAAILLPQTGRTTRALSLLIVVFDIAVLQVHPEFAAPRISPYKPFSLAMQFPGAKLLKTAYSPSSRVDLFESPAVRFAPGLSFTYLDPLPSQTGIAVDAGDIYAVTSEADQDRLAFVQALPSSLAYRLLREPEVLVIEPRAGLALLTARRSGARMVYAVDSNPLVVRTVRDYGPAQGSRIYGEHTGTGLARVWLSASTMQFDVIDLSFMGSMPSAAFGFAEDYRFTVEAFETYLAHLKPDGMLSLSLYIIPPPRTELRLLATLAGSAQAQGIADISRNIAAVRSWDTLTMIMKKSPLTQGDIERIKSFAKEMRFDLVYYPGIRPGESNVYIRQPGNEYAGAFMDLLNKDTRDRFLSGYLFDVRPVTDEKPFFHYYMKLSNIRDIYKMMGEKWQFFIEEGYLLPVLLIQVIVAGAVLVLIPLTAFSGEGQEAASRTIMKPLSYFALLGMAYLFIEIAFIQKMILCLENPSSAASTAIASILICSGMGSLLSRRFKSLNSPRVLIVLAAAAALYGILLPGAVALVGLFPFWMRVILSFILVMPAGILMGIPFPLGISGLGGARPRLISWAWAVNGCFSVLAPVLATMLALSAGFQSVLLAGAASYLAAFWMIRRGWDPGNGNQRESVIPAE